MDCSRCGSKSCSAVYCFECKNVCENPPKPPCGFDILGLPCQWQLDQDLLEKRYLELSKACHPDLCACAVDCDRARILQVSSAINQAYRDIKDKRTRAQMILQELERKKGIRVNKMVLPPGFLMEILEIQEELEGLLQAKKRVFRVEEILSWAEKNREKAFSEMEIGFCRLENEQGVREEDQIHQIRSLLNSIRYYDRIIEISEGILDEE